MAERTYTFERNPIALLEVSLRHTRQQIIESTEEASLTRDQFECSRARSVLTNPKDRIYAELSWLPGVSPRRASELLVKLDENIIFAVNEQNVPQLTKINLICSAIEKGLFLQFEDSVIQFLDPLTYLIDAIDLVRLQSDINEDRSIAKFPLVTDQDLLKEALLHRINGVVVAVMSALEALQTDHLLIAMNKYADTWTSSGTMIQSHFAEAVLNSYDVQSHYFLSTEATDITKFSGLIKARGVEIHDNFIASLNDLKTCVRNWTNVARPVQLQYEARGLKHDLSMTVAHELIGLAFYIKFELELKDESLDIANFCSNEFWILTHVRDYINADISRLKDTEQKEEIDYKTRFGLIFKTYLEIKDQSISFKRHSFKVKDINRLRWAISDKDSNLKRYKIGWGNEQDDVLLLTFKEAAFTEFREILLHQIGYSIVVNKITAELKSGTVYVFPHVSISDDHVILERRGFFSRKESRSFEWKEVFLSSSNDSIRIGSKNDKNYYADLKYLDFWNINLLSMLIEDKLKKVWVDKLSQTYKN